MKMFVFSDFNELFLNINSLLTKRKSLMLSTSFFCLFNYHETLSCAI